MQSVVVVNYLIISINQGHTSVKQNGFSSTLNILKNGLKKQKWKAK